MEKGSKTKIDWRMLHVQFQWLQAIMLIEYCSQANNKLFGLRKICLIISWVKHQSTYTARRVAYQQSPVHQHYSLLCIDRRPTVVFRLFRVSRWVLHRYAPATFRNHSVNEKLGFTQVQQQPNNYEPFLSRKLMGQDSPRLCTQEWQLPLSVLLSDHSMAPLGHSAGLKN